MLSIAEAEADRTSERIKAVLDRKIAMGECAGGTVALGYKVENKHYVIDPPKADIVRGLFDTYLRTASTMRAHDYLMEKGIHITYNSTLDMLRDKFYIGVYRDNKNYCEPIIPLEQFEAAQKIIASRSVRTNQTNRVYLFSGLIFCKGCGNRMSGTYRSRCKEGERYQYRCNNALLNKKCDNKQMVREAVIERYFLKLLKEDIKSISAPVVSKKTPTQPKDNSKKLARLTDLYVDGHISKEEYLKRKEALTEAPPPPKRRKNPNLEKIIIDGDLEEHYNSLSREEKRELWRSIVYKIEVTGKEDISVTFLS